MKILHTADWHHTDALGDVTGPAIDSIVEQAAIIKPDGIVIAGDLIIKRGIISPQESLVIRESILRCAEIAPTLVIPGNHDLSNRYDRVDAVQGLLARLKKDVPTLHDRLYISSRPDGIRMAGLDNLHFFTLPHPSKYLYLSKNEDVGPNEIDGVLTSLMEKIVNAFAIKSVELRANGIKPILVGHGTVNGGVADSEKVLTAENDLVIDRHWLGGHFDAIMYGHLHMRQNVGEVFYCGNIAPVTFAQEAMVPSFEIWEIGDTASHEPVEIPVTHQMLTAEIGKDQFADQTDDPMDVIFRAIEPLAIKAAKVRVRIEIPRERRSLVDKGMVEEYLEKHEVINHKVMIDTIDPLRIRADNLNADLGMDNMLEVWSELDADRANSLPLMKEINAAVAADIPHESLYQLQGIDYRIQRIAATNFKPLIDVDINFGDLGSIICITGENHVGKSQVAELERFVYWKKLRKGTNLNNVVRHGQKQTEASIWFIASDNGSERCEYRATRSLKLDKTGEKASGTIVLSKKVNDEWLPMNEGDSGETQASIERMVGSYDMYLSTRFGSQQDIDYLCSRSTAEMKDILQEAMNFTAFDLRENAAGKQLKELRSSYENVTMKMESMAKELEQELDIQESLKQLEASKTAKGDEIEGLRTQRDETQRKIDDAKGINEKRTELTIKSSELAGRITTEETKINELVNVLAKKDDVTSGIQRVAALESKVEEQQETLNGLITEMEVYSSETQRLTNGRSDLQTDVSDSQQAIEAIERVIEDEQTIHDGKIRDAKAEIERAESTAALTGEVPCEGMDFQGECKLLGSANDAKGQIEGLKSALATLEAAPPDQSGHRASIESQTALKTSNELKIKTLIVKIVGREETRLSKESIRGATSAELVQLRDDLRNEKLKDWPAIQEKVLVADTEMKNTQTNVDRMKTERFEALQELEETGEAVDTATLHITVDSLSTTMTSMQNQQEETIRQIGVMGQNLERMESIREELKSLEEVNSSGLARINAFVHYLAAVSRDGIPYLLMEKALPRFSEFANEFLCVDEGFDSALRVKIDPVKDTQQGKEKDEVVITFNDDRGNHPLGEASGFQRVAIGYSLRAALAKIQAESTGVSINHCIFDEGWGAFDQKNLILARRMIEKLGEEFGQFFYITHVPVLQEVADTILHVTAVNDGAIVAIAA